MSDLVVTKIAVDDAAEQIKKIVAEFEGANKQRDENAEIWGHPQVRSAMYDFVEDWWVKREKLTGNLKDLQKKMEQAAQAWTDLEIELSKSLEPPAGA
ncbi:hypothetical protein [Antribacter gilvus]|uniref:hypothetical protein n=1 Tax=Antribacter gilvus TaxID=2304675 RepID=UPI000F7AC408|nr:hypothetical protein [Antribacter gilvus]